MGPIGWTLSPMEQFSLYRSTNSGRALKFNHCLITMARAIAPCGFNEAKHVYIYRIRLNTSLSETIAVRWRNILFEHTQDEC